MRKKTVGFILLMVLILTLVVTGCGEKTSTTANETQKPVAVNIAKVTRTDVESIVTVNGKVKPVQDVNVMPKMAGRVDKVFFEIGESVRKGDLLFQFEQKDTKLQLSQAEAALSIAKATYAKTMGGMLEQQMIQLETAYESAKTNYDDAKTNYERTKELFDVDGVSKSAFESAESRYKLAEQQYQSAKANYELTKSKINPENIASAKAQMEQAQSAYEIAKSQYDNTMVRSPINGVVGSRNVKSGEMTSSAVIAMNISDLSSGIVEVGVTEDVINKIHQNDKVKVTIEAMSDKVFEGIIKNISPVADLKTQTYQVKIEINNENGLLKGGMFSEIRMVVDKVQNVVAVPLTAIIDDGENKYVYVIEGDTAKRKDIETGYSNDELVQVIKGVNENETIVVKGQNFLQEDSKVVIVK